MPQAPQYNRVIERKATPQVRVNSTPELSAFGGGALLDRNIGKVMDLGEEWKRYNAIQRDKADKVKYEQSRVELNKWERDNVYDPRTGAAGTVGEEALGIETQLSESLDKFSEEHKKTLGNERQKFAFDGMVAERRNHVDVWAKQHVSRQMKVVEDATYAGSLESSKERAVLDKSVAPMELERIKSEVFDRYKGKFPPESQFIQQEIQKHETDLHNRIVDDFISKNQDGLAEGYFNQVKDRFDPDKVAGVAEKIKRASERIKKENLEALSRNALGIIEQTKDFNSLPENVVDALPLDQRRALRNYAKMIQKGDGVDTDLVLWYGKVQEATGTPEQQKAFAQEDLTKYVDQLGTSEFKNLVAMQSAVRAGKGRAGADKVLDGYRSDTQVVDDVLRGAGIRPNPNPETDRRDAERVANFRKSVDEKVMQLQAQTGRKATNEDIQKISDGLIMKGAVEGTGIWGFGQKQKFAFEAGPGEKLSVSFDDIPQADVNRLREMANRRGYASDDDSIELYYNQALMENVNGR